MPLADIIPESKVAEEPQAATSETYHFATGDVSDYDDLIQEIKEPKQKFVNQEPPTAVPEQKPAEVPLTPRLQSEVSKQTSKFIVNSVDRLFSFGMDWYADAEEPGRYAATDDEKKEMVDAWQQVLKDTDKGVPPWLTAVATMILIYGCKAKEAHDYKRVKQALEKEQLENAARQAELDKVRAELETLKNKTNEKS